MFDTRACPQHGLLAEHLLRRVLSSAGPCSLQRTLAPGCAGSTAAHQTQIPRQAHPASSPALALFSCSQHAGSEHPPGGKDSSAAEVLASSPAAGAGLPRAAVPAPPRAAPAAPLQPAADAVPAMQQSQYALHYGMTCVPAQSHPASSSEHSPDADHAFAVTAARIGARTGCGLPPLESAA